MSITLEESKGTKELVKLHSMLRDLEESNDLPSPSEKGDKSPNELFLSKDVVAVSSELEDNNNTEESPRKASSLSRNCVLSEASLLGGELGYSRFEDDIAIEEDDSWLLRSPIQDNEIVQRKPRLWLAENIRTPELNRVKGSLASKVDLILIQSRKDKLNSLLAKHNHLGSHPESAPGRLYAAESMCSVMSMDWEYDEDDLSFAYSQSGRSLTAPQYSQITEFDDIESAGGSHATLTPFSDSQIRRRQNERQYFVEDRFDELQPMTLNFDSSPMVQRGVQLDQEPVISRRSGMQGNGLKARQMRMPNASAGMGQIRRPSFSDRSDSSGDFPPSPHGSLGSSRNSLESLEDIAPRKSKTIGGRVLLPIASFFNAPIPEEDLDFQYENSPRILNPYTAWDVMRDPKPSLNQVPSSVSSTQADPSLTVKLPAGSPDGPVIRRRGVNVSTSHISKSVDSIPRPRKSSQGFSARGKEEASPSYNRSNMPRPRTALPSPRKGSVLPHKRLSQKSEINLSPDILARTERSSDRRSQSPDLIPKKSGIVRRGQVINRSYHL